ncbi:flagellar protein FlaG [Cytobacillus sp. Hz8]|uniref:flagellar protein FlaG n=1 Tax=Cytobacillus sp. Hz8 TaxID=3347168 RepID=UPI0035D75F19
MINQLSTSTVSPQPRITEAQYKPEALQTKTALNISTNDVKEDSQEQTQFQQKKVQEVVKGLNDFIEPSRTSLKFEYHEKLDEYYVKLIDENTHEVIREIPSKKVLDMYAAMKEFLGLMVDKKI